MYLTRKIDGWLNGITMYRLLVYVLGVYAAVGISFSFAGVLSYNAVGLLVSLVLALASCYLANLVLSWVWNIATNKESWLITALILFCIMPPASTNARIAGVIVAGCAAMAGKFLLAIHGKHLFNPAAFGAVAAALLGLAYAGWWIGTPAMLPLVVAGGLLVVRKTRRFAMVTAFIGVSLVVMVVVGILHDRAIGTVLTEAFTSWPLIFFATIMLTEPSTLPSNRPLQVIYAVLTGVLFSAQLHYGVFSTSPHMVLVLTNVFSYIVSSKGRMLLQLHEKKQAGSSTVYDFAFTTPRPVAFKAGQYIEWTLPHAHADERGNRRTFSIASSPTERTVHLGVKFYKPSSSFKRALFELEAGSQLWAGHVAGDFVLPGDPSQKMVWLAGGIGITPFRSMAKYIIDTKQQCDIVLFYAVADPEELMYMDVFKEAAPYGLRVLPVLTVPDVPAGWTGLSGFITADTITSHIPDYADRRFYMSGPNAMTTAYRSMVRGMGVPASHIVTDYFSGY